MLGRLCAVGLLELLEVALGDEVRRIGIGVQQLVRGWVAQRCERGQRPGERVAVLALLGELPVVPFQQGVHPHPLGVGAGGVDGRGETGVCTADRLVPGEALVVDRVQHAAYVVEAHAGHLGKGADQP